MVDWNCAFHLSQALLGASLQEYAFASEMKSEYDDPGWEKSSFVLHT